ncbi:MAG: hypothetical protein U0Q21_14575 [Dermatophilaceae bacterium]
MGIADWFGLGRKQPPRPSEPIIEVPAAPTAESLSAALDEVETLARAGAVPPMVMARLKRVTGVVRQTIPRLDSLGGDSSSAYNVMATATDYLPGAIGGYLRLPRDWADSRPVDRGKTSLLILIDQLDLLGSTMDKVFDAVCRADAQALVVHGRFLQEKFGAPAGGSLGIDPRTALPPMPDTSGALAPPAGWPGAGNAPGGGSGRTPGGTASPPGIGPGEDDTGDVPLASPRPSAMPNSLDLPAYGTAPAGPPEPGRLAPPIGRDA